MRNMVLFDSTLYILMSDHTIDFKNMSILSWKKITFEKSMGKPVSYDYDLKNLSKYEKEEYTKSIMNLVRMSIKDNPDNYNVIIDTEYRLKFTEPNKILNCYKGLYEVDYIGAYDKLKHTTKLGIHIQEKSYKSGIYEIEWINDLSELIYH